MLEQRRGNRLSADLVTDKTRALGWSAQMSIDRYIESMRERNWIDPTDKN